MNRYSKCHNISRYSRVTTKRRCTIVCVKDQSDSLTFELHVLTRYNKKTLHESLCEGPNDSTLTFELHVLLTLVHVHSSNHFLSRSRKTTNKVSS